MQRVLVALVLVPFVLACVFLLPSRFFLLLILPVFMATAMEFARLARHWASTGPMRAIGWLVAAAILVLGPGAPHLAELGPNGLGAAAAALLVFVTIFSLGATKDIGDVAPTMGFLTFAPLYFSIPAASAYHLQAKDPWLVVLLCGIVWCGDSAAYYVGSALGRRKMAPVVSPNKTWEGAAGGFIASLAVAALWCQFRLGAPDVKILIIAAASAMAAQVGDLAESAIKRGAGVKDSSQLIPGHGGLYDRLDAMLLAAPVLFFGLELL